MVATVSRTDLSITKSLTRLNDFDNRLWTSASPILCRRIFLKYVSRLPSMSTRVWPSSAHDGRRLSSSRPRATLINIPDVILLRAFSCKALLFAVRASRSLFLSLSLFFFFWQLYPGRQNLGAHRFFKDRARSSSCWAIVLASKGIVRNCAPSLVSSVFGATMTE